MESNDDLDQDERIRNGRGFYFNGISDLCLTPTFVVALYAPETCRRQVFWNASSCLPGTLAAPSRPSGVCHIAAAYVIAGFTTALYTVRARLRVTPYMEVAVIDSARHCLSSLAFTFLIWVPISACHPRVDLGLECYPSVPWWWIPGPLPISY